MRKRYMKKPAHDTHLLTTYANTRVQCKNPFHRRQLLPEYLFQFPKKMGKVFKPASAQ